jgi:hypothetical protein
VTDTEQVESKDGDVGLEIDTIVKSTVIGGAIIYGALFFGYRTYYKALGMNPEDVGIGNTFILVRGIGFVLLACGIAGAVYGAMIIMRRYKGGSWSWGDVLNAIYLVALAFFLSTYLSAVIPSTHPLISPSLHLRDAATLVVIFLVGFMLAKIGPSRRTANRVALFVAAVLTIALPAYAINQRAAVLANESLAGRPVSPYAIFGIPILDVSSDPVDTTWICAEGEQPALFKDSKDGVRHGLLLGANSSSVFIRLTDMNDPISEIVKLPQMCVMVARYGRSD